MYSLRKHVPGWCTGGEWGGGRYSWDPMALLFAVRGDPGEAFITERGVNTIHAPSGGNTWIPGQAGPRNESLLLLKVDKKSYKRTLMGELDDLYAQHPMRKSGHSPFTPSPPPPALPPAAGRAAELAPKMATPPPPRDVPSHPDHLTHRHREHSTPVNRSVQDCYSSFGRSCADVAAALGWSLTMVSLCCFLYSYGKGCFRRMLRSPARRCYKQPAAFLECVPDQVQEAAADEHEL